MRSKRDERVVEPITKTRRIGQLDEIRKSAKIGYSQCPDPKRYEKMMQNVEMRQKQGSETQ